MTTRKKKAQSNLTPCQRRALWLVLLAISLIAPVRTIAIEMPKEKKKPELVVAAPFKAPANEQELRGMALYNQNCRLCHDPMLFRQKSPMRLPPAATPLKGYFAPPKSAPEELFKTFVNEGVPNQMPAFKYGLSADDMENLIIYIKSM